ncbi:MAG TPA: T9SS type A sorting domain-containing protein [Bacteroidetes bacterium]|nr:T9SS type A sorting domain-containing protein [Bacteroidota bacterium]
MNSGCSLTLANQALGSNAYNAVAIGDFNNDGKPDVFTAARDAVSCTFINDLNTGASPFYEFTGNGSWSAPSNWNCNTTTPPTTIPSGRTITINGSGTTNLDIDQSLAAGSSLSIAASKTLQVANGNTLTNHGTLTNDGTFTNNGILKGSGTLVQNGTFTNSATGVIAPGASPGKLTVTGDLDLGSGTYLCEINGTGQGTTYDWLAVSGQATLTNATLTVDWGAFTPSAGDVFTLMTFGSRGGTTFGTVTIPAVAGLSFTTSYTGTAVSISAALLPVELTDFRATLTDEKNALLFWKTASETDNEGFEIQRSADGRDWQKIGFVAGHGTTLEAQDYSFIDEKPFSTHLGGCKGGCTNYYRLRQMDFDGASGFSKTVAVFMENTIARPRIFPTLTDGVVMIENNGEAVDEVSVFNVNGQMVMAAKQASQLDLSGLEAGIYFIKVFYGKNSLTERVFRK